MTRLIVHHCTDSRSFRTIWLLHEMGLDFEVVTHEFGQNLQDSNFLAISPVGRVPALEHGGLCLSESGAITEYLCETFPTPLFRAPGSTERPQWLQWLHLAETMGQLLANLTQQHIVIWEDKDRSPLVMKLERRRLEKLLDHINQTLADQPFPARNAGLKGIACTVTPTQEGITLKADLSLPSTGGKEVILLEADDPLIWASEANTERQGGRLVAQFDLMHASGGPFALNRSALRFTVLGHSRAVDVQGCN